MKNLFINFLKAAKLFYKFAFTSQFVIQIGGIAVLLNSGIFVAIILLKNPLFLVVSWLLISFILYSLIAAYYQQLQKLNEKDALLRNLQEKKSPKRHSIIGINAVWDDQILAHCIQCDSLLTMQRESAFTSATLFHFCPTCKAFRMSWDSTGDNVIGAKEAQQIAITHINALKNSPS